MTNFFGEPPKSSLNRELPVHRKTSCCKTIDQAAVKDESLFLIVGTQCKCTNERVYIVFMVKGIKIVRYIESMFNRENL